MSPVITRTLPNPRSCGDDGVGDGGRGCGCDGGGHGDGVGRGVNCEGNEAETHVSKNDIVDVRKTTFYARCAKNCSVRLTSTTRHIHFSSAAEDDNTNEGSPSPLLALACTRPNNSCYIIGTPKGPNQHG